MPNGPLTALPRLSGCVQFMGTTATCRPFEIFGRSENRCAGRSGALTRGVQRSRLCEPAWSPFLVTAYRLILSKISLLMESCASSNLKEMHCVGAGLVPARTAGGVRLTGRPNRIRLLPNSTCLVPKSGKPDFGWPPPLALS
jgi:hypothetical protein